MTRTLRRGGGRVQILEGFGGPDWDRTDDLFHEMEKPELQATDHKWLTGGCNRKNGRAAGGPSNLVFSTRNERKGRIGNPARSQLGSRSLRLIVALWKLLACDATDHG